MIFTIVGYNKIHNYTECVDENGKIHRLDLTTDASFKEITDLIDNNIEGKSYENIINSFKGRKFECEKMFPYIPCYFVVNAQFIKT